jgi:integrase
MLKEKKLEHHRSDDSYCAYKFAIAEFLAFSGRKHPAQVTTADLLGYAKHVEEVLLLSERTRWNRMMRIFSFLRFSGLEVNKLVTKSQKAKLLSYTEKLPDIYTPEQLKLMLEHSGRPFNRVLVLLAVSSGFREQELQYLGWNDVNFEHNTLSVTKKPEAGFTPKDNEERSVPMSQELSRVLADWRKVNSATTYVLETAGGKTDGKLLDVVKRIAKRAGLNCGVCSGCKAKYGFCRQYSLHKFRRTYITRVLRKTDLRTAMALAGHSDIQSTMRYLRPEQGAVVQDAVNSALADIA